MPSPQNEYSPLNWKPYPVETREFPFTLLIAPMEPGIYGTPGNQVILTSNHHPSFNHLAKSTDLTCFMLDGGGFPTEVAASFELIPPPHDNTFCEYVEFIGGDVTFYISPGLSISWGWKDGDERLGGIIRVMSYEPLVGTTFGTTPVIIRVYAALRLALIQLLLLFFSIVIINSEAFIPTAVCLLAGMMLISVFWNYLPGNGWMKGGTVGLMLCTLGLIFIFLKILFFSPLFFVGVFVLIFWVGGLFMRSQS